MKLATLRGDTPDGVLVVVSRDGTRYVPADDIAPTMLAALDQWDEVHRPLEALFLRLEGGEVEGLPLDPVHLAAPLPRTWEWLDGSAFLHHVVLVRRARGAEPPETLLTDPLMYQGGSGDFLGPRDAMRASDEALGLDFEAEIGVVVGDTPVGTVAADVEVRLVLLLNDVTLRNLIPAELAKGFGFVASKPATAFAPLAVTPDELGEHWREQRLHLPVTTTLNGERMGHVDAGAPMHFSFGQLVAHVARTRRLRAGTIVGSGTVSTEDPTAGVSCLAEARMREIIAHGAPKTTFLRGGDRVRIEVRDPNGASVFGAIDQRVVVGDRP